jgi:hypothetical protein
MECFGVLTALFQAIYCRFNAHAVAFLTIFNAVPHLWCDVAHPRSDFALDALEDSLGRPEQSWILSCEWLTAGNRSALLFSLTTLGEILSTAAIISGGNFDAGHSRHSGCYKAWNK